MLFTNKKMWIHCATREATSVPISPKSKRWKGQNDQPSQGGLNNRWHFPRDKIFNFLDIAKIFNNLPNMVDSRLPYYAYG
jgi:hypothetical protein